MSLFVRPAALILLLSALPSSNGLQAQPSTPLPELWREVPLSFAGPYLGFEVDQNLGWIYIIAEGRGLLRSIDQGTSWQLRAAEVDGEPQFRGLALDRRSEFAVIYRNPLSRSDSLGAVWEALPGQGLAEEARDLVEVDSSNGDIWAIRPYRPNLVVTPPPPITEKSLRLFRSTDQGQSFQPVAENLIVHGTSFDLTFDTTLSPSRRYLRALEFIAYSDDGFETWDLTRFLTPDEFGDDPEPALILDLALDPSASPATLYAAVDGDFGLQRSDDGGLTWEKIVAPEGPYLSLAVDGTQFPPLLYALSAQNQILRRDPDGGWRPLSIGLPTPLVIEDIELDTSVSPAGVFAFTRAPNDEERLFKLSSGRTLFVPQVAGGRVEGIGFETSLIVNNLGEDSEVLLEFFDAQGQPMTLPVEGSGESETLQFPLRRGRSRTFLITSKGQLRVGYARVSGGFGLAGTAVFTRKELPRETVLYEAGVPFTEPLSDFSVPIDTRSNRDTGLALVNLSTRAAELTLRLYDQNFQLLAQVDALLPGGGHLPRFVTELFEETSLDLKDREGLLTVESDQPLAAVSLRQNQAPGLAFPETVPTLTVFPVSKGRPEPR